MGILPPLEGIRGHGRPTGTRRLINDAFSSICFWFSRWRSPACVVSGTRLVRRSSRRLRSSIRSHRLLSSEVVTVRPGYLFIKGRWDWRNGNVGLGRRPLGARARRPGMERRSLGAPRQPVGVGRGYVGRVERTRSQPADTSTAQGGVVVANNGGGGTWGRWWRRAASAGHDASAEHRHRAGRRGRHGRRVDVSDGGASAGPRRDTTASKAGFVWVSGSLGLATGNWAVGRRSLGARAREPDLGQRSLGAPGQPLDLGRGPLGRPRAGRAGPGRSRSPHALIEISETKNEPMTAWSSARCFGSDQDLELRHDADANVRIVAEPGHRVHAGRRHDTEVGRDLQAMAIEEVVERADALRCCSARAGW